MAHLKSLTFKPLWGGVNPEPGPEPKPDTHEYVDLGLPSGIVWATENIKDTDGNDLYFAWGETQGYTSGQVGTDKYFVWSGDNADYKYGTYDDSDTENYGMTKYNKTDGKTVLESTDDAAVVNWGNGWRMPTKEEYKELLNNLDGYGNDETFGIWFEKDGDVLTIPSCGYAENGIVKKRTDIGYVPLTWLNSRDTYGSSISVYIESHDGYADNDNFYRCIGLPVRPVRQK